MITKYVNNFEADPLNVEDSRWASANGFCVDANGKVCVVWEEEKGRWNLPGGGREAEENPLQNFIREVKEESQANPVNIKYLHAVHAKHFNDAGNEIDFNDLNDEYKKSTKYCFRYICKLENIEEFIPRKNGVEIDERKFVTLDELPNYLPWLTDSYNGLESFNIFKTELKNII